MWAEGSEGIREKFKDVNIEKVKDAESSFKLKVEKCFAVLSQPQKISSHAPVIEVSAASHDSAQCPVLLSGPVPLPAQ